MLPTQEMSAILKQRFKAHFSEHGYDAALPMSLDLARKSYPIEWAEACQEWEAEQSTIIHPMARYMFGRA